MQPQEPAVRQAVAQPPASVPVASAATMVASVVEADNPDTPMVASDMAANDPIESVLNDIESRGMSDADKPPVSQSQNVRQALVWVVQVASYGRETDALSYARALKGKGYDANVTLTDIGGGKTRYRVEVGPLASRNEALALQKTLRSTQRIEDSLVLSKLAATVGENR
jgi:cell division septation protein DedD